MKDVAKIRFVLAAAALALGWVPAAPALAAGAANGGIAQVAATSFTEIKWTDLIPKGWDPLKFMPMIPNRRLGIMSDLDPEAQIAFAQMRLAFDNAPTVPEMNGARVKLPGYLVPPDEVRGQITEFLLVPYFGACIHTPPPPANQIVFVRVKAPIQGFHAMDTVLVAGELATTRQDSALGASGYKTDAVSVDRYAQPSR